MKGVAYVKESDFLLEGLSQVAQENELSLMRNREKKGRFVFQACMHAF